MKKLSWLIYFTCWFCSEFLFKIIWPFKIAEVEGLYLRKKVKNNINLRKKFGWQFSSGLPGVIRYRRYHHAGPHGSWVSRTWLKGGYSFDEESDYACMHVCDIWLFSLLRFELSCICSINNSVWLKLTKTLFRSLLPASYMHMIIMYCLHRITYISPCTWLCSNLFQWIALW